MKVKTKVLFMIFAVCGFLIMLLALPAVRVAGKSSPPPPATLTVHSNADAGGSCPGANCTLRQAIAVALPGDTIDFDLTTVSSPITLSSELAIDKNLTIQGPGTSLLTISGNNAVRVFNIGSVMPVINVTISGLTIANGRHRGTDGASPTEGMGGGILNNSTGTLAINNSVISGNSAIGGSNNNPVGFGGRQGLGGGIDNASTGTLSIANSTISGNVAKGGNGNTSGGTAGASNARGGGIYNASSGSVTLTNSTLSANSASDGNTTIPGCMSPLCGIRDNRFAVASEGGGVYNSAGSVNILNSTVSGNSASGGNITVGGPLGVSNVVIIGGSGGGVYNNTNGTVRVTNSTFFGNSANGVVIGGAQDAAAVHPLASHGEASSTAPC